MNNNEIQKRTADEYWAEIYDQLETQKDDVALLRELIRDLDRLRILEPFCGNGRILIPLAEDGHEIVGMDLSGAMLASGQAKIRKLPDDIRKSITIKKADVTEEEWPVGFDLVILGGNCFYELETPSVLDEKIWLYSGIKPHEDTIHQLYQSFGYLEDDPSLIMASNILPVTNIENDNLDVRILALHDNNDKTNYMMRHNQIFIKKISLNELNTFLYDSQCVIWGLFEGDRLLGECLVYISGEYGYIETFYVYPEFRGTKHAHSLMRHVIAYFKEQGQHKMKLEVWQRNMRAIKFYQKYGFSFTGEKTYLYPGKEI